MSDSITVLINRLLSAHQNESHEEAWRSITGLTDANAIQQFWLGLEHAVEEGKVPWISNCACLWPVERRARILPLLHSRYPNTRYFVVRLAKEWDLPCIFEVFRAFELGYYDEETISLLPQCPSDGQAAQLVSVLLRANDSRFCRKFCEWVCKNRIASLYGLIVAWLGDTTNHGAIDGIGEWAGQTDFELPHSLKREATRAALDRLKDEGRTASSDLIRLIVRCGAVEDVIKAFALGTVGLTQRRSRNSSPGTESQTLLSLRCGRYGDRVHRGGGHSWTKHGGTTNIVIFDTCCTNGSF